MPDFLPCFYAFCACIGFCIVFEVHNRKFMLAASLSGAAAWFVYLLLAGKMPEAGRCFIATLVVAVISEILARIFKAPATIFLIVGIIPLVPGGGLYDTMDYLLKGDTRMFEMQGTRTVASAIAIAVGCSLVTSIVRIKNYRQNVTFVTDKENKIG